MRLRTPPTGETLKEDAARRKAVPEQPEPELPWWFKEPPPPEPDTTERTPRHMHKTPTGDRAVRIVSGSQNGHTVRALMDALDRKNVRYHREAQRQTLVITIDADELASFLKET